MITKKVDLNMSRHILCKSMYCPSLLMIIFDSKQVFITTEMSAPKIQQSKTCHDFYEYMHNLNVMAD